MKTCVPYFAHPRPYEKIVLGILSPEPRNPIRYTVPRTVLSPELSLITGLVNRRLDSACGFRAIDTLCCAATLS